MMLEICALASGSNGNSYYIGNENDAVLIDAGISCKQILLRMEQKELDVTKIKAVFISHEHADHSRGARVLGKRLHIPVYVTPKTYHKLYKAMKPNSPSFFNAGESTQIGEITVHSFLKNHDASDPCSFRVEYSGKNIGIFTDIGEPCDNVISNLKKCDAIFLETNYDEQMLLDGPYPYFLKQRISSNVGHLSNDQALKLINVYASPKLKVVFLSHLSAENNTPDLAFSCFQALSKSMIIEPTSRKGASKVLLIK